MQQQGHHESDGNPRRTGRNLTWQRQVQQRAGKDGRINRNAVLWVNDVHSFVGFETYTKSASPFETVSGLSD